MVILWSITLLMTMQREIGLVSSKTMGWIVLTLMVIFLIALLVGSIQGRRVTWPARVRWRVWGLTRRQNKEWVKGSAHSQTESREEETNMNSSTKDKAQGKFHEVKGKIKEQTGKLISNAKLEGEGKKEKSAGKVQQVIGNVKNLVGK